jgi:hypothetical protein
MAAEATAKSPLEISLALRARGVFTRARGVGWGA